MNRRSFLKICSSLPFVGSLAVVGRAVASEDSVEPFVPWFEKEELWEPEYFRVPSEHQKKPISGLEEAFVYGGRLFRVFNQDYDEIDGKILQVRHRFSSASGDYWTVRYMMTKQQFLNHQYLMATCEHMLRELERRIHRHKQSDIFDHFDMDKIRLGIEKTFG